MSATSVATSSTDSLHERGIYDGAELKPYTGRTGAMDAFKLKSLCGARSMYEFSRQASEDVIEHPAQVK